MSKTVQVKVKDLGVKTMSEASALRLIAIEKNKPENERQYSLVEPPRMDVLHLPKLPATETEKKSVIRAEEDKEEVKPKRGRPANA